jgi:histidine kinase
MEPGGIKKMHQIITLLEKLHPKGSLRVKVIIGISLILTVVMSCFTYFDMVTRTKFYSDKQEERAREISDTVMKSIEYPMLDGEMMDVRAILERLHTLPDVAVLNLSDTNGVIRHSGLPSNIGMTDNSEITKEALRTGSLARGLEILLEGENILQHAMPILNENPCHKCHGAEKKILGTLAVGISWTAIEERIAALRNREITLTIVSLMVVGFFLTAFLSKYITRPLAVLARLADEISRGKPGFEFGRTLKCWVEEKCDKTDCPAYGKTEIMCWYVDGTYCKVQPSGKFPEKLDMCRNCSVYKAHVGDEMVRLADSFKHMLYKLKIFEKEMRRSEEKYRLLFDTEPNPVFILDRETLAIQDANARAVSQYDFSKEDLLKMSFIDLGYEENEQEIISGFKDAVNSRSIVLARKRYRGKDGGLFYTTIHVCGARYMGKDALIATTTDVTESVRKDAQFTEASKMATLGEMATGVAHELNQPLSVIQIGTDFFRDCVRQDQVIPPDELTLVSEQMAEQVDRATRIINHLREFGRRADIQVEEIDINKPLGGVFTLLSEQLRLRGIKVVLDLKEGLPRIMADSNRLEQVFMNLVVNARQTIEEKKQETAGVAPENTLTVRSFQENGRVVVTVTDTGKGIPETIREKIFQPFFTTKKVGKGTGLGLSISYEIVKDYKGTIEAESAEGKGSTFKITFPVREEEEKGAEDNV